MAESNLSVKRAPRDGNFKTIDLTALEDPRLSESAKCVHAYAVTRPDGWRLNVDDLCRRMNCSEQKIAAAFRLLQMYGYLVREKVKAANGRFEFRYTVIERPSETSPDSASVDSTSVDCPPVENGEWTPIKNMEHPTDSRETSKQGEETTENDGVPARYMVPLSPADQALVEKSLSLLAGVPGYPDDPDADRQLIVKLRSQFPGVELIDVLQQWEIHKLSHPLTSAAKTDPRCEIRNWVKKASEGGKARPGRSASGRKTSGGDFDEFR